MKFLPINKMTAYILIEKKQGDMSFVYKFEQRNPKLIRLMTHN